MLSHITGLMVGFFVGLGTIALLHKSLWGAAILLGIAAYVTVSVLLVLLLEICDRLPPKPPKEANHERDQA